jgi:tetratricopeptide (TPR) repeat protein
VRLAGVLGVLAITLGAPPLAAQRKWGTPAEAAAARGREAWARGDCRTAVAAFDDSLARDPNQPAVYRDRGQCHEQLGAPQPAMSDYRAYLARLPNAPDAAQIRARLGKLEAQHAPPVKAPNHGGTPPAAQPRRPDELEDPFQFELAEKRKKQPVADDEPRARGFLLGPVLGVRGWSSKGFPKTTQMVGGYFGWAWGRSTELGARVAWLQSGADSDFARATGWGVALLHSWSLELTADRAWEIALGVGGGYESQTSKSRTTRDWLFGLAYPRARWNVSEDLLLELGPEVGLGMLASSTTADSSFAMYYGGTFAALWRFGVPKSERERRREEREEAAERAEDE